MTPVHILGRFPPPYDGQTLATELSARLLDPAFDVRRLDTQVPGELYSLDWAFSTGRVRHYLDLRGRLRAALAQAPDAPVLWHAISPTPLGHWRDMTTTLPAVGPRHAVHAVMHRATFERLFASPLTALTARRLVERMTSFVFQSPRLAEACAENIPSSKQVLIPNTVDEGMRFTSGETEAKQAAAAQARLRDLPLRLLFASNMLPEKGHLDVLGAAEILDTRGVPVEADFVGGWPSDAERQRFEARVRAGGLEGRVRVHGSVSDRATMRAFHLAADVFLLPTYYPVETQPKAIIEALGAATPVVSTRRGIIEDMVREGDSAYLVPPQAPEAIADVVERLREPAHWQRLSAGARARFETAFSPEVVGARWARLVRGEPLTDDVLTRR